MPGFVTWIWTMQRPVIVMFCILWILLTILKLIHFDSGQIQIMKSPKAFNVTEHRKDTFTILFYIYPSWFGSDTRKIEFYKNCKYKNCNVTFDHSMLSQSDVVIFYHVGMKEPPTKLSHQKWIFVSLESPHSTNTAYNKAGFKNKFDWTITYRQDSEGFAPYGLIIRRNKDPEKNYKSIYENKTKEAVWVVSHCNTISKREKYINEMSKYIGIDTYGKCGRSCDTNSAEECKQILSKTYKYYLSFENTLCNDYMTEKISTIYMDDMNFIPVVRGAPNAKDYLPKNTFVLASDFKSPKDLAEYLKRLGQNKTLYTSILKEKDKYYYQSNSYFQGAMCEICGRLNNNFTTNSTKDLEQWLWRGQCIDPNDIHV